MSGAGQSLEPVPGIGAELRADERRNVGRGRGRRDAEAHPGCARFADQPCNARTQRRAAVRDQFAVDARLAAVDERHHGLEPGRLLRFQLQPIDIDADALLAARGAQQFGILLPAPIPGQRVFQERGVESLAVGLLGIGDGAVDIEYQRLDAHAAASG